MACLLSKGRKLPCKEFVGGLYKVLFANYGTIQTYLDANNKIVDLSGITSLGVIESAYTLYEYELKGTSKLTQEITSNREAGTTFVTQTLVLDMAGGDYATNNEIKLLAYGRPHIFVQDNYGSTWYVGYLRGMDVTTGIHDTGAAIGDKYGYTITLVGQENEYALQVDGSTILDAFAGITNKPTIVKGS